MLILKPCFPVFSKKAGGRRWAETNQCEHWDVHSVGFFWHFASQQTFLLTSERFSHPKSRSQTWIPALPAPPNPKSKPWQGIPALCWAWIVLSMGLGWARGEKAVGKPACVIFPPSPVAAERRHPAHNGVKKVKGDCCGSSILNYVFMDLHNGLSDGVLLFEAQSGNCGRSGGGRQGWRSTEGGKRGKLKT